VTRVNLGYLYEHEKLEKFDQYLLLSDLTDRMEISKISVNFG
jgi:hypothetical protein